MGRLSGRQALVSGDPRTRISPACLAEAHYIARSGRPGPVVVDLTKTAQTGEMYYSWPQRMILPGYNPTTRRTAA